MTRARDLSSILAADGSLNISTSVNLADNEKAYFGTSNDLQIYHDASDSWIVDNGTGGLKIGVAGTGTSGFYKGTGSEVIATFEPDGPVTLYHNNAAKLATTATGVDVTGTVTSDGLNVSTSSSGAYGAIIYNTNATGEGLTIRGGSTSSQNALVVQDYNGSNALLTVQGSGNVGIGTGSPSYKAEISDGTVTFGVNPLSAYSTVYVGTTTNHGMNFITNGNSRLNITSSGNVGIGTASPTSELHLHVSGASNGAQITFDNDYGIGYVGQENNTSNNLIVGSSTAGITFYAANAEKMRIDSTGKVGIQETSPDAYLHVKGKASYTTANTSEVSGLQFVRFQPNSSNEDSLWFHNSGNALGISAYTDAATTSPEHLTLQTYGGNVGIGTNNPTSLLHTQGNTELQIYAKNTNSTPGQNAYITLETATSSGGNSYLRLKSGVSDCSIREISNGLSFQTGTFVTERMRIDSSGRVTMPYQPSFSCYKNGIMTEASGNNRVENWTENHDQGGHLNNSTGRFTAPVSGKYFFTFSAMHSGLVTGDVQYSIYKNGAIYQGSNDTADGGNWDQCTVVTVVDMAVNDYVEPYAYSSTTSTRQIVYSGRYSGWHGYLIG